MGKDPLLNQEEIDRMFASASATAPAKVEPGDFRRADRMPRD
jgi:hypothetical protein